MLPRLSLEKVFHGQGILLSVRFFFFNSKCLQLKDLFKFTQLKEFFEKYDIFLERAVGVCVLFEDGMF